MGGMATMLAALAMLADMAAQVAEPQCLTPTQVDAVVITAMPELLGIVSRRCGPSLPATAILRAGLPQLVDRLRADGAAQRAEALRGLERLTGVKPSEGRMDDILPTLGGDAAGQIAKLKVGECASIEQILRLISPLPPRDIVRLIRVIATIGDPDEFGGLTICEVPTR